MKSQQNRIESVTRPDDDVRGLGNVHTRLAARNRVLAVKKQSGRGSGGSVT